MGADPDLAEVLKRAAPSVLGALVRRGGDFETCEDAVQEAMLAAHASWPRTVGRMIHERG